MKKEMAGRRLSGLAVLILAVFLSVACSPAVEPQIRPAEEAVPGGPAVEAVAAQDTEHSSAEAELPGEQKESQPAEKTEKAEAAEEVKKAEAAEEAEKAAAAEEVKKAEAAEEAEKAEAAEELEKAGAAEEAEAAGETEKAAAAEKAEKAGAVENTGEAGEVGLAEETGSGQNAAGREKPSPGMLLFGLPADFDPVSVPAFGHDAWADINDDVPFFTEKEMEDARSMAAAASAGSGRPNGYQVYGPLDTLGRCTGACALVGTETLPQGERGNISSVKPTGWHKTEYDHIDGGYLYNRCHLIGFALTGQNINEQNLITGTRYMNVEGMLPYEDSVLAYVRGTGNHVLYRVSPLFEGDNLLASGVLMEARSIEDPLVQFCAFCYNVQPGIEIDYTTGESRMMVEKGESPVRSVPPDAEVDKGEAPGIDAGNSDSDSGSISDSNSGGNSDSDSGSNPGSNSDSGTRGPAAGSGNSQEQRDYIVNVRSRIFHHPYCDSVKKMKEKNKQKFTGQREELVEKGYKPCQNCNP